MKKLICCLLVISMLFAMSTSAFAGEVGTVNGDNANSEEGCIIDMTEVKEMPKSDLILYEKYKVREGDLEQKNAYALQKDNVVENVFSRHIGFFEITNAAGAIFGTIKST